jgi:23S rRNA pseudouridine2605 synthase
LIEAGRVRLNGRIVRDPEQPVELGRDRLEVDGKPVEPEARVYLMLNKPRGLVTTVSDERGRETVYSCLPEQPRVSPVGRLDKASEGLLLFSNDTVWAARVTDPVTHLDKIYHAQVSVVADDGLLQRIVTGVDVDGDFLAAKQASLLRTGAKNCWLEIVLDEGKNRHIRRLMKALGAEVLRLVRVAVGAVRLGDLKKGQWRHLDPQEVLSLAPRQLATLE